MRTSALTIAASVLAAVADAKCKRPEDPSNALATWFTDAVTDFFPYRDGWDTAYDKAFSKDVDATFNATRYNFDTLKKLYGGVRLLFDARFQGTFNHGFISAVGVPNAADNGGFVTVTGWEGGYVDGTDWLYNTTDAVFAVITEKSDCSLKITEFRETSNLGFGKKPSA